MINSPQVCPWEPYPDYGGTDRYTCPQMMTSKNPATSATTPMHSTAPPPSAPSSTHSPMPPAPSSKLAADPQPMDLDCTKSKTPPQTYYNCNNLGPITQNCP